MRTEIQNDAELGDAARPREMVRRTTALAAAAAALLALTAAGCSGRNTALSPAKPAAAVTASIEIEYAKSYDMLNSLTVTQFTGATVLRTHRMDAQRRASIVRFDGGVPVWRFHSERSILNPLSVWKNGRYHVTKVHYGKLPPDFLQDVPDFGPPAPLEADSYYVFTIERSSGALSYQAVKVNADGSLETYDAEPRAGTSYRLCCNVRRGFIGPEISPDFSPEP